MCQLRVEAESQPEAGAPFCAGAVVHLQSLMLPALVQLLSHDALRSEVPAVLARLIAQHDHLQRAVAESDAMQRLSAMMVAQVTHPRDQLCILKIRQSSVTSFRDTRIRCTFFCMIRVHGLLE